MCNEYPHRYPYLSYLSYPSWHSFLDHTLSRVHFMDSCLNLFRQLIPIPMYDCRYTCWLVSYLFDISITPYYILHTYSLDYTVTPKSVTITNLKPGREAPRNHPWEFRFTLVGPNRVQTLGYKPIPGSCDSVQRSSRYDSFKTAIPL